MNRTGYGENSRCQRWVIGQDFTKDPDIHVRVLNHTERFASDRGWSRKRPLFYQFAKILVRLSLPHYRATVFVDFLHAETSISEHRWTKTFL
jgi:hypothetical protein